MAGVTVILDWLHPWVRYQYQYLYPNPYSANVSGWPARAASL